MPERTVIVSTAPPNPLWDRLVRAPVTGSIRDWPAPWTPASGGVAGPWPFGTVVRRRPGFGEPLVRLLVLVHEGSHFTALVLRGAPGKWPDGTVETNWTGDVWEPDV